MPPLNGLHENLAPRNDLLQHLALACRQFRLDIRDGRDCVLGGREGCVCELSVSVGTTGTGGTGTGDDGQDDGGTGDRDANTCKCQS